MLQTADVISELKKLIIKSEKPYDLDAVDRAITAACKAHEGQRRSSGEAYVCHPLKVACILVELGMDSETIEAAILHDVVEDTPMELADVQKHFGAEVATLVDGVTKIEKIPFSSREEQQAENVRKMLLAMSQDIRVIIIKLADRLHNMRTSDAWPPQKRRDKAKETMDIYAPLAHRLGIRAVKEELEDISLRILDPVAYKEIEDALALREGERNAFLMSIQERIRERLAEFDLKPFVSGRIKSITGIYRKMYMQGRSFEEIYDVYAVRVIVDTVNDCYNVLGIIHDMFRPIPNRFKDYISTPKSNMYQSLHTTVISKEKIPFEVQIRTWEMHYTAEYGIAAHWKYKLGIQKKDKLEERLAWVRQFIENQKDVDDAEDIVRSIKTDLSSDDVFVFTPKGEVITLPVGATVIDFAYAIHSAVGNRMVGAKVNGRIVTLDHVLKNGDIVEILTSKNAKGPSRDWMKIARSSEARSKIRQWFKKEKKEENIANGRAAFEAELKHCGISMKDVLSPEMLPVLLKRVSYGSLDDMYAAIGYGGFTAQKAVSRIQGELNRVAKLHQAEKAAEELAEAKPAEPAKQPSAPKRVKSEQGIIVEGLDNCLVKFSKCCTPVPGDDIIGFITRGYGVSVHRCDCPNASEEKRSQPGQEGRWIKVSWGGKTRESYRTNLQVVSKDRPNLLVDISTILSAAKVHVSSLNARSTADGFALISLAVDVSDSQQLQAVMRRLEQISGVMRVTRPAG